MNAWEAALDEARSHARSKEQKLSVITKELKASRALLRVLRCRPIYCLTSLAIGNRLTRCLTSHMLGQTPST